MSKKFELFDVDPDAIEFTFNPPEDEIGNNYNLKLVIQDLSWINKTQTEYDIIFEIIPMIKSKYTVTLEDEEDKNVKYAQPTETTIYGEFQIVFSKDMIFPDQTTEWTSQNEGADYIELIYKPSEASQIYFSESGIDMSMEWSVSSVTSKSINIQLIFAQPLAISRDPYESDKFSYELKKTKGLIEVEGYR